MKDVCFALDLFFNFFAYKLAVNVVLAAFVMLASRNGCVPVSDPRPPTIIHSFSPFSWTTTNIYTSY